jgi:hypothetical protein
VGVLHLRPDEIDAQLELRRRRCRRVNVWGTFIGIEDVQLQRDVAEPQFSLGPHNEIGFVTRLSIQARQGQAHVYLSDADLRELADTINTYLQRPGPPVQVNVQLQQPRPRRRKKKAAPAALEQLTEEQLIKRRMLEGR